MKITNIILLTLVVGLIAGVAHLSRNLGARWEFLSSMVLWPAVSMRNNSLIPKNGATFTLRVGQVKQFQNLSVQLASIDRDTRCHSGATCTSASQGEVILTLLVTNPPDSPNALVMRIPQRNSRIPDAVGYYVFTLVALTPSPSSLLDNKIATGEYQATFKIKSTR
jgi:hypothetical protein